MGLLAATVAGLGTPSHDGTPGLIRTASGHQVELHYNAAQRAWIGRPRTALRQKASLGMATNGAPLTWKYPSGAENPDPGVNSTQYGFQIHKLVGFGDLWAAGLRLQEHLSAEIFTDGGANPPEIALNWYDLAAGDAFLTPLPTNQGVRLVGDNDLDVYHWFSSGWQNSPIAAPAPGRVGYPELYTYGQAASFRHLIARYRWAAGTLGALGSFEQPAKRPPIADLLGWYRADEIPQADGAAVAEWADYSGRSQVLLQATAGKRPIVTRDAPGAIRYVRFDGVDDALKTIGQLQTGNPFSVFIVLRQNAGGGAQQVWVGPKGAGASLIYRGDAVDQVNVWAGGADLIYHRPAPWPSPFLVWSVVCNGALTEIYEGDTLVASGNAGAGQLAGLTVGNNDAETLPAKLDVAELIISFKAATTPERTAVIDQLQARYGL